VTNDALHHLHYLHVNFKSLVMKEEEHPNNIDTMERHSKMLGLCKICIPNPPQRNCSLACTSYQLSINSFHTLHAWYIASCLLWFSYDPFVICLIPNACFKFKKWHLTYFHHKNSEWKSTPGSKWDQRSHKRYFILILHVFFPQNNFFIRMNFEWFFLQLVMRNDYNFPNNSSKKIQSFFNKYEFVQNVQNPCRFYVSYWKMMIIWNHTKKC